MLSVSYYITFIILLIVLILIFVKLKYLKLGYLRRIPDAYITENKWFYGDYYYPSFNFISKDMFFHPKNEENLEMTFFDNSIEQNWNVFILDSNFKRLAVYSSPEFLNIYHEDYDDKVMILIKFDNNFEFKYKFKLTKDNNYKKIKDDVIYITDEELKHDIDTLSEKMISEMNEDNYNLYDIKQSKYFYSQPIGGMSYKTKLKLKKGDAFIIICSDKNKILNIKNHKIDIYTKSGDLIEFFHAGEDIISKCLIFTDIDESFEIIEQLPLVDEKSRILGFKVMAFSKT